MRALFACTRGAGHFNPLVPFIEAWLAAGHEAVVVGPPPVAPAVQARGYAFHEGAVPPEDELGAVWGQVPSASYEEAERLVIGEIFATLNVRAMLPAVRDVVARFSPDLIVREPAEFASAVVAEEAGLPHVQVGIGLVESHVQMLAAASEAVERWRPGLTARLDAAPYLTLFPEALETPGIDGPRTVYRFRDSASAAPRTLPDWWGGDERPLVYVTFGSVSAGVPTAAPIYDVARRGVAGTDARVLFTTGSEFDGELAAPGPHVHVERWVPQGDVLPHARAVVCHGGSGTTLGALAAGVPLVVTPLFADQPQNARRVAAVGAGIALEPRGEGSIRSDIDPGDLRDAIAAVLEDERYVRGARVIADEIGALPSAGQAVEVLAQEAANAS